MVLHKLWSHVCKHDKATSECVFQKDNWTHMLQVNNLILLYNTVLKNQQNVSIKVQAQFMQFLKNNLIVFMNPNTSKLLATVIDRFNKNLTSPLLEGLDVEYT